MDGKSTQWNKGYRDGILELNEDIEHTAGPSSFDDEYLDGYRFAIIASELAIRKTIPCLSYANQKREREQPK